MNHKAERFHELLRRYIAGDISLTEQEELFSLLSTHAYDDILEQSIQQDLASNESSHHANLPPHIAQEIIRNIYAAEKSTAAVLPASKRTIPLWRWVAAASMLVAVALVYMLTAGNGHTGDRNFASIIPSTDRFLKNNSDTVQTIVLQDGSQVFLKPQGTIHYPDQFNTASQREVYLEGEAFFQVAKNPQKPFLVFYNHIVTKVLGTSFTVHTNAHTGNVEVAVRTGRVQVYENDRIVSSEQSAKGVIIMPNQKAIYKKEKRLFETTLVELPQPVQQEHAKAVVAAPVFVYEQEKLKTIFNQLERVYGIEIIVENTDLYNCVFTGDLSVHDLFTQLKIICLTTNSAFEINGTRILIRGKGCH